MTNPNTAMMRAISRDAHGSPEVLKEVLIPRPVPGLSEVLVAVRAAGVNPTDWRNRAQALKLTEQCAQAQGLGTINYLAGGTARYTTRGSGNDAL